MSLLILWGGIFLIAIFTLIKASDIFTSEAEKLGVYFGIPSFIIGVTIVAIGTSLPELVSSIFAVFKGSSEIVASNVIGSNITNIFLILGICALINKKSLKLGYEILHVDMPMLMGSAFLLLITAFDGIFTLFEALLCLAGITLYLVYISKVSKTHKHKKMEEELKKVNNSDLLGTMGLLLFSAILIYVGAHYTIESVLELAKILGVGTGLIAATIVALGTSLPELMVIIMATKKGLPEMAVGNILGSNIFNSFAVMGISGLFGSLVVPDIMITFGLPIMIVATLLYYFITEDKEITKWEGALLIIFYIYYLGTLLNQF